ncbi:MAG: hypothetical protein JOZ24_00740, partial [Candidatus Eremiobacteraeota bacterium]|nr:hypothetical protein [Candidatus Eremiobacteraeota bacterium]
MSSAAASRRSAERAWELLALGGCIALSAVLLVIDAKGGGWNPARPDLQIELVARGLMLVLALFAVTRTAGDRDTRLLIWAVVLVSLDAYWQTTYRHLGGRPLEWAEMIVKYVAVGTGLGVLLRLCAQFGDAPRMRFRALLHDWSFAIGGALTAVGL